MVLKVDKVTGLTYTEVTPYTVKAKRVPFIQTHDKATGRILSRVKTTGDRTADFKLLEQRTQETRYRWLRKAGVRVTEVREVEEEKVPKLFRSSIITIYKRDDQKFYIWVHTNEANITTGQLAEAVDGLINAFNKGLDSIHMPTSPGGGGGKYIPNWNPDNLGMEVNTPIKEDELAPPGAAVGVWYAVIEWGSYRPYKYTSTNGRTFTETVW